MTQTSALGTLRKLAAKKPVEDNSTLATQLQDPALAGAKRDKNVVRLGLDPAATGLAKEGAELKGALDRAKARYEIVQAQLRDYGAAKRDLYQGTFKAKVTTMAIPYVVEAPTGPEDESETPGRETRYAQVICQNKYSVQDETVLALEPDIGPELFPRLFEKKETRKLKANATELIQGLLQELGMEGEELDNAMEALFDVETKVNATKSYEDEIGKAPESVQTALAQCVQRVSPSVKFNGG